MTPEPIRQPQKSSYCEHCGDFHDPEEQGPEIRIGMRVPRYEFELLDGETTEKKTFHDYLGTWMVAVFYPANFTPESASMLTGFKALQSEFAAIDTKVVAFSTDTLVAHQAWRMLSSDVASLGFPLAADPSGKVAFAFGALTEGGEYAIMPNEGLATPSVFYIDAGGILRASEMRDTVSERVAEEALRNVREMKG